MITPEDIEFMKQTRAEIVAGRQSAITLIYADGGAKDPITGEVTEPIETSVLANAVVTEISSTANSALENGLVNGIVVEKGDIWFSVDIDTIASFYDQLERVNYDGKDYEILSKDKKGIGQRNRAEFVGRLIT